MEVLSVEQARLGASGRQALLLQPHACELVTGERDLVKLGGVVSSVERDLLHVAAAVFAADRAVERGEREGYQRSVQLTVPVVNIGRLLPLQGLIERVLRALSNDAWEVRFQQAPGDLSTFVPAQPQPGRVLLFSGGLDSLAGAIAMSRDGLACTLVSHVTHNQTVRTAQANLASRLGEVGLDFPRFSFFVSSKQTCAEGSRHDAEESQRTRSFVFLLLAAIVASRRGHEEIVMIAENGQMAIHLPLNGARLGGFSTHTAHPEVLGLMEEVISGIWERDFRIVNPFVYRTKAEVVRLVLETIPAAIPESVSCWRSARLPSGCLHCGECVPCYVRRIALESLGSDPTTYARNPWAEDMARLSDDDQGKRNLVDLCEFIRCFATMTESDLTAEWPELYSNSLDAKATIAMYRRFAKEGSRVLSGYPAPKALLS